MPLATLTMFSVIYALGFVIGVGRTNAASHTFFIPSRVLHDWAVANSNTWLLARASRVDRIVDVDVETGETLRDRIFARSTTRPMLQSEDGVHLYRVTAGVSGNDTKNIRLESINLKTGRSRRVADLPIDALPPNQPHYIQCVIGFVDEGRRILVVGSRSDMNLVLSVEISSGAVIELVSENALVSGASWTGAVNDPFDATVLVTIPGAIGIYLRREADVCVYDLTKSIQLRTQITLPARAESGNNSVATHAVPVVSPDGSRFFIASANRQIILDIDIGSGECTLIESPTESDQQRVGLFGKIVSIPTQGNRLAIAESIHGREFKESSLLIFDTRLNDWVARLTMEHHLDEMNPAFSRNGRHLATIGSYSLPNAGPGGRTIHKLVLHDLTPLDAETDEPE